MRAKLGLSLSFYELWHHQGWRARMGTAMMGPDYTQWQGFYEVAKTFYTEFIPEAEVLLPDVTADVMNSPYQVPPNGFNLAEEFEPCPECSYKGYAKDWRAETLWQARVPMAASATGAARAYEIRNSERGGRLTPTRIIQW